MKQSNRSQQLYLVNVSVVIMLLVLVGIGVCVISYCISQAICQKKEF